MRKISKKNPLILDVMTSGSSWYDDIAKKLPYRALIVLSSTLYGFRLVWYFRLKKKVVPKIVVPKIVVVFDFSWILGDHYFGNKLYNKN